MSSGESEDTGECLATRRGRREKKEKTGRLSALEKLKECRSSGKKCNYQVEQVSNVYEYVDEKEYAKRVRERRQQEWIVGDGDEDGYAEDGREIFDEDYDHHDDKDIHKKKNKKKQEPEKKKSSKNIKNMFLSAGNNSKSGNSVDKVDDDALLGELLSEAAAERQKKKNPFLAATTQRMPLTPKANNINPPITNNKTSEENAFAVRRATGIKRKVTQPQKSQKASKLDELEDDELNIEEFESQESEPFDDDPPMEIEEFNTQEMDKKDPVKVEVQEEEEMHHHRGFQEKAAEKPTLDPSGWIKSDVIKEEESSKVEFTYDGQLPFVTNNDGEKVLRMYWLDAHEDVFKNPGTVWLFGKVYAESAKAFVSICLTVKNITRKVYLSKKDDFTIQDVYQEFDSKISGRYKITEYKSRPTVKKYVFEHVDIPDEGEYLEIQYNAKYPALPSDLSGNTFSRVFGANQGSLEHFLMSRKIKGPSWIDIKCPTGPNGPPISWCKIEAVVNNPSSVSVLTNNPPSPPPVVIMSLNMKTVINPKTQQNEISIVSALTNNEFHMDKPPPKPAYKNHFCAISRPSDEVWPFDIQKALNSFNTPVNKMDTERALLGFVLAKIGKIDPDIIIGHDVTSFDLEILLHRTIQNKIPHWSRLGRLKRSAPQQGTSKQVNKNATTGRLVCDLKISAKELIRCKSYDLGSLIEKLIGGQKADQRLEITTDEMRKAYASSANLLNVINSCLSDAANTLQCVCDLNALPLALQITQVAGNVMSRTLLGGRAERNEFLLLHAFEERNYIPPDKIYGKRKAVQDDDLEEEQQQQGRKKPSYAGGLVLDPKKGFYDKYILLMDFNSLYPSIIQEYNICFTTVKRESGKKDEIPELPESGIESGVLPTEIRKLVESRKVVKKLLKEPNITPDQRMQYDIRQKALKLTANSMYGCLGFSHSRFYAKPLAALVTSRGREILLQTRDLVEKMNLEVIYGDTDSIMINSNCTDFDQVYKLGAQIKTAVNKLYRLLELDIDGVYRYMLLLKKKKYAAVTMEKKSNGELESNTELKGLDIVRRDWSQIAADAGKYILNKIMTDISADERISVIHEKLESLALDLNNGKVPLSDLAITKQLTKDPNNYPNKKALSHVQVALRMNSKGGKKIKSGDTVPYVICDDGSNLAATQRAYHVDEIRENSDLKIDIQYYLSQQLHPVVSRLVEPLEGTDSSRLAQCLGLDPNQYRKSVKNIKRDDDEDENTEENKFRNCEKFKINCECGSEIVVDNIMRGNGLALISCPDTDCKKIPLERFVYIRNKLVLAIREHLKRYYAGWVVCEDPGCTGRTRQLPLTFQRAFPVCSTCHKATMYREYSDSMLYNQLIFFQRLFDTVKAKEKYSNFHFGGVRDRELKYYKLYEYVKGIISNNNYSVVSLTKVFEGFFPMTAEKMRSKPKQ